MITITRNGREMNKNYPLVKLNIGELPPEKRLLIKLNIGELPYSKQDLLDFLGRHTNPDPKRTCGCKFTGNTIDLLLQKVGVELDLDGDFVRAARNLARAKMTNRCLVGNRLVIAATLLAIAKDNFDCPFPEFTNEEIASMFFTSDISIRNTIRRLDLKKLIRVVG